MMSNLDQSLLQYDEYAPTSLKLLDRIEQEWFKFCASVKQNPKEMYQQMDVIPKLAKLYRLKKGRRKKSVVYLDDLVRIVETTVTTTKKKFGVAESVLPAHQDNHPEGPNGGPNNILIEFTVEFAKTFLGDEEETTFVVQEIIFDPSPILSPHVFLLGLLFADRAFALLGGERILTSARQLIDLKIPEGINQLKLHLDPALDDVPVIRKSERTLEGIEISATEALTYATIKLWIKRIGEIAAFRDIVRPYSLRYGAGKALDDSGHISEAVRSLIFQHSDPCTFIKYYLHRKVTKDIRSIVQGLDPQEHIMNAALRMLLSVDPRRPQELTTAQSRSVNRQPHIQELIRKRDMLSRRLGRPLKRHKGTVAYELHKKISCELAGARQRAKDELLRDIQGKYDFEEPLREIKRQLSGIEVSKAFNESLSTNGNAPPPPHKRLTSAVLTLPCETLRDEMLRRTESMDAVAEYSLFEEGDTSRLPHDKRLTALALQKVRVEVHVPPAPSQREITAEAVMKHHRPLYCFYPRWGDQAPRTKTPPVRQAWRQRSDACAVMWSSRARWSFRATPTMSIARLAQKTRSPILSLLHPQILPTSPWL
ncbi:hypothetical protein ACJ73_00490 [Blastomyces percursus]|uniref:Uncharacterized protein n=1 Tax=Blastomyces percursus TaxID=1658174 RepID=A0A1J9RKG0_9EURO|nr:hypothetical protein ACJ73_00490 [Blastomyces percursus]